MGYGGGYVLNIIMIAVIFNPFNILYLLILYYSKLARYLIFYKLGTVIESALFYYLICKFDYISFSNVFLCVTLPCIIITIIICVTKWIIKKISYKIFSIDIPVFKYNNSPQLYIFGRKTDYILCLFILGIPIIISIIMCQQ